MQVDSRAPVGHHDIHAHEIPIGSIIDIGGSKISDYLRKVLMSNLIQKCRGGGRRFLPDPFMSDDRGLQLWRELTHLPEYYQTREEIESLKYHGTDIAKHILPGSTLVDLGSG